MKVQNVKISEIKNNPNNPRLIKDEKFKKLVKSIQEFPKMLEIRPIVVNEDMIVLGGNMRLKACKEAGLKEIPIIKASDLTEEQQKQFIIKDNVGFGEWDWDILANEWDVELLGDWGLELWDASKDIDLEDLFEEGQEESKPELKKIVLEFTEEEYDQVKKKIDEDGRPAETIFRTALDL